MQNDAASGLPAQQGWRAFFEKNKGLAYVLLAQLFGTLMNVTTRVLEMEGNNGNGMHPFQVQRSYDKTVIER